MDDMQGAEIVAIENLGTAIADKNLTEYFMDSDATKYICQQLNSEFGIPLYVSTPVLKIALRYALKHGSNRFSWISNRLVGKPVKKAGELILKVPKCGEAITWLAGKLDTLKEWLDEQKKAERLLKGDDEYHKTLSWDMAAHLRELNKLDSLDKKVHKGFSRILELLTPQPQLCLDLHLSGNNVSWQSRFTYKTRFMPFVGRDDALTHLADFLAQENTLLSWEIVTGPGGSGKSRLALELCLKYGGCWYAGKVDPKQLETFKWSEWEPERPTLLVVDYAALHPRQIHDMLRSLITRLERNLLQQPVRLLLLEREARKEEEWSWFNIFLGNEEYGFSAFRYKSKQEQLKPYLLSDLGPDDLTAIFTFHATQQPDRPHSAIPPTVDQDSITSFFSMDSKYHRPLFAALAGDALGRQGSVTSWDPAALLADVVQRDLRIWDEALERKPDDEQAIQDRTLIALSTMAGGISCDQVQAGAAMHAGLLPNDAAACLRYGRICGTAPLNSPALLPKWEPDLVGEFFVLNHLNRYRGVLPADTLRNTAWFLNPRGMQDFLLRVFADFADNDALLPTLQELGRYPHSAHKNSIDAAAWTEAQVSWADIAYLLAIPLGKAKRFPTALCLANDVKHCDSPALQSACAKLFFNIAYFLHENAHAARAISILRHCLKLYKKKTDNILQESLCNIMFFTSLLLYNGPTRNESVSILNELIGRFRASRDSAIHAHVARAMVNLGLAHAKNNDPVAAARAFQDCIDTFRTADAPPILEQVAKAMVNMGAAHLQNNDPVAAARAYQDCIDTFRTADAPPVLEQVARAMVNLGALLGNAEKHDKAAQQFAACIDTFRTADAPPIQERVAKAMVNLGAAHLQNNDPVAAAAAYQDCIDTFRTADAPPIQERVAMAMVNLGVAHAKNNDPVAAAAAFQDCIDTFRTADAPPVQERVAMAMVNMGILLHAQDKPAEARMWYLNLIQTFGKSENPQIQVRVEHCEHALHEQN